MKEVLYVGKLQVGNEEVHQNHITQVPVCRVKDSVLLETTK